MVCHVAGSKFNKVPGDLAVPIFTVRATRSSNLVATDVLHSYPVACSSPVSKPIFSQLMKNSSTLHTTRRYLSVF